MKTLYLLPLALLSCKHEATKNTTTQDSPRPQAKTIVSEEMQTISLWDFNGDGKEDNDLTITLTENKAEGEDNPTQGNWTVVFNNKTLPELQLTGGEPIPVGEGDLNGDGAAELTIIQAPNHGCTYNLTLWSFQSGKWQQVFGPELIPTACDPIDHDALKQLIVKENGKVYFYRPDMDDENFKKVKTEVKLRN